MVVKATNIEIAKKCVSNNKKKKKSISLIVENV